MLWSRYQTSTAAGSSLSVFQAVDRLGALLKIRRLKELSMTEMSNSDVIKAWSNIPQANIERHGDEGDFARKYLLNPILFSLLGDVTGKAILDAGCGQGYLCRLLARKGANVTGIEPADPWYHYALQREQTEQLGIRYLQADLSEVSPIADSFDYVIANMVFMDIPDYLPALQTCIASLKMHGKLIVSLLHPCFEESGSEWKNKGYVETRDYFQERSVKQTYGYFVHRPLSFYLNSIIQAGCMLQQIIEPQLEEAIARQYDAERYYQVPGYIVISAIRTSLSHPEIDERILE
jgi:2-polyprenyl-3-methyl-5-hydroxy-6-metoxy-1,4-benzoquinol methylase